MVDLTTLEGSDTPGKVRSLAAKARRPDPEYPGHPMRWPRSASTRTWPASPPPNWSAPASASPRSPPPSRPVDPPSRSSSPTPDWRSTPARPRSTWSSTGAPSWPATTARCSTRSWPSKRPAAPTRLKVILETGELATYDNVRRASWLAMLAGGDFIKTSTGKISPAATLPVIHVMLQAVHDWHALDRRAPRGQAGRRDPEHQGRTALPGRGPRGGRTGMAGSIPLPIRRFFAAQRSADAAAQPARRPLLRPQLCDGGLAWASRTPTEQRIRTHPAPGRSSIGSTHRPRSPRPSGGSKTATRCSSAANSSTARATTSRR